MIRFRKGTLGRKRRTIRFTADSNPMNWLAHLHLSEPTPAFRIGNLLPDILRGSELQQLPVVFAEGVACHRAIDVFTDSHPVFRRSTGRIQGPLGRYRAILVDLFYDHFLSREWLAYSSIPLDAFIREFYDSIESFRDQLPDKAYVRLVQIREGGWLTSYGQTEGIGLALEQLGRRLRRPVDLRPGVDLLIEHHDAFGADFREFYPQLVRNVGQ